MESSVVVEYRRMLKTTVPILLLEKGVFQVVDITSKMMLRRIMGLLGAEAEPEYRKINCAGNGVKFTIKLQCCFGQSQLDTEVEGKQFSTTDEALGSAIEMAFKKLSQEYGVQILDYSSKVAMNLKAINTCSQVAEGISLLNKIIEKINVPLQECKEFGIELERREMRERFNGDVNGNKQIYETLGKKMLGMARDHSLKSFLAKRSTTILEKTLLNHQQAEKEREERTSNMTYSKTVVLPAKESLMYVLNYFGFGKPNYYSTLQKSGLVKAVVELTLPYMKNLRVCGVVKEKATGFSTEDAEEKAAFEALRVLEKNLKIRLIDINHSERVEAEAMQNKLVEMIGEMIAEGEGVKKVWENMNNEINQEIEKAADNAASGETTNMHGTQKDTWNYCHVGLLKVAKISIEGYKECFGMFEELQKIDSQLKESNMKFSMF